MPFSRWSGGQAGWSPSCENVRSLLNYVKALVQATLYSEKYGAIRQSTKGLIFFGTPHNGGNMATVATPVANIYSILTGQPRNDLLKTLEKDSLFNEELIDNFNPQKDDYDVVTFFEARVTDVKIRKTNWRLLPQFTSMVSIL